MNKPSLLQTQGGRKTRYIRVFFIVSLPSGCIVRGFIGFVSYIIARRRSSARLGVDSNHCQTLLDLTKAAVRKGLGVSLDTITGDRIPDVEACRAIADLARLQGYDGILSPSAAADGKKNFNLYIDGRADDVSLMEGLGREALNYR